MFREGHAFSERHPAPRQSRRGQRLSIESGKIDEAKMREGAVFVISTDDQKRPYIEDATATQGLEPGPC